MYSFPRLSGNASGSPAMQSHHLPLPPIHSDNSPSSPRSPRSRLPLTPSNNQRRLSGAAQAQLQYGVSSASYPASPSIRGKSTANPPCPCHPQSKHGCGRSSGGQSVVQTTQGSVQRKTPPQAATTVVPSTNTRK
jgi:hypothetical protein